MKTLQEIINRQKKFHEKFQAKSDLEGISSSKYRTKQISNSHGTNVMEKHEEDINFSEKIDYQIDAVPPIKVQTTRKKCLITNLPKYKGFSVPGNLFTGSGKKNCKPFNVKGNFCINYFYFCMILCTF